MMLRQAKKKTKTKRARIRVQPKPAEYTPVGKLIRQMGSLGGGALGSFIGNPGAGSSAGHSLGGAISKWLGYGDYTVGTNSIVQKASTGIPMMHKEGQTVVIRHREFIDTIESSTGFALANSFQLNPGNSTTFPWLSTIANSFQEYRFRGVVFHYVPTSGNAISGTSPSLGSVMFQTSYRSNDSPPSSKSELLNEYWSGEVIPSETMVHPIECNPAENPFNVQYVRRGDLPSGDNQLFYDLGVTNVCTQGQLAAGNTLGDVWVTYEVELKKPIVASNVTSSTNSYVGSTALGTIAQPFAGLTKAAGSFSVTTQLTGFTAQCGSGTYLYTIVVNGTTLNGAIGAASVTNGTVVEYAPGYTVRSITTANALINVTAIRAIDPSKPVVVNYAAITLTGAVTVTTLDITKLYD
jgi:hypothetical protein